MKAINFVFENSEVFEESLSEAVTSIGVLDGTVTVKTSKVCSFFGLFLHIRMQLVQRRSVGL